MELKDVLQMGMQQSMAAAQLTDLRIGTVTSEDPLEITVDTAMAPLTSAVLYLTESVVEKKIPILAHTHITSGLSHVHGIDSLSHSHTLDGSATSTDLTGLYYTRTGLQADAFTSSEELTDIVCTENGTELPVENGYIILNRKLETGDKVLLLRVAKGQKFVVLSRVMEG